MAAQPPTLHFLPWVRQGAAADIRNPDTLRADQDAVVKLPVDLWINRNGGTPDVSVTAQLYGPADVTGIDPQQVVRTEPRPLTSNFEPNLFPAIEFDRPDFPWLFTPLSEGVNDQLRPWLVLVVVKKQDGVTLTSQPSTPLPVLAIKTPARPSEELPDLREAHAWAHAQVSVDGTTDVTTALHRRPERTVSRLLCPRRLESDTAYLACVVPAFAVGRDTGLGLSQPAPTPKLTPAWSPTDTAVTLPVYYSWEFSTGPAGDFELLAQQLRARPLPGGVGQQRLDISQAGSGLPVLANAVLPFAGALLPLSAPEPTAVSLPAWQGSLQKILNAPDDMQALTPSGAAIQAMRDPLLAPPLYGSTHAGVTRVDSSQMQTWTNELNLDPRQRVTSALGTQVVQREQEQLMAEAWEQLEVVQAANQALRLRQLAQATHDTLLDNTIRHLSEDDLLQMTAPTHSRLAMPGGTTTLYTQMQMQRATATAPYLGNTRDLRSTALRRVTRPRGAINRRFLPASVRQAQTRPLMAFLQTPAALPASPRPASYMPYFTPRYRGAMVTMAAPYQLPQIPQRFFGTAAEVGAAPARAYYVWIWETENRPERWPARWEPASAQFDSAFRAAAVEHLSRVRRPDVAGQAALASTPAPALAPGTLLTLLRGTRPVTALTLDGTHDATTNTDMILAHPEFPQPMYEPLRELAPESLLPGLEHVPPNTAVLMRTNPTFIEAFMAGLNTEMARELLWREYPTDQRGTCFHHFWDTRGASATQTRDIDDLHLWTHPLGHNKPGGAQTEQIVLLLRGELLRRYPGAIIYAVRAVGQPGQLRPSTRESDQVYPLFRGALPPDVTFIGFPLTENDVLAQPGWFFVIQQQPGEPQFGFDAANGFGGEAANLNALSWGHLVSDATALQALRHVSLQRSANGLPKTGGFPPGVEWGKNAAHMARITLQRPVRVALHSAQMLTPG
jgi:hypothetical protein